MQDSKFPLFKKGDTVKRKEGGSEMTMEGYSVTCTGTKEKIRAFCVWKEKGKECSEEFIEDALELAKAKQ